MEYVFIDIGTLKDSYVPVCRLLYTLMFSIISSRGDIQSLSITSAPSRKRVAVLCTVGFLWPTSLAEHLIHRQLSSPLIVRWVLVTLQVETSSSVWHSSHLLHTVSYGARNTFYYSYYYYYYTVLLLLAQTEEMCMSMFTKRDLQLLILCIIKYAERQEVWKDA